MKTQTKKPLHLQLLVGGMAAILVSSIAIGSLAISPSASNGAFAPAELSEAAASAAPDASAYRCAECGMIESTRRIDDRDEKAGISTPDGMASRSRGETEGKPFGSYAITIRLRDGSTRVITDAHPARWRPGERVMLIGGME